MSDQQQSKARLVFPDGFLIGAATASHQVEGDNFWNDWWQYEQSGLLPFKSGRACDHFNRFEEDFDLASAWGHNAHRLSIEWSRIQPEEGDWNDDAVAHYVAVFDALRRRGLEPIVTLNHFTLPSWFLDAGGWTSKDSPARYAKFVDRFVREAGRDVTYWLTLNEPTVYVEQSYLTGHWPPQKRWSVASALKVTRNLARAHVEAYRSIRRQFASAKVGFAHAAVDVQPCDPERLFHRTAASVRDYLLNDLFFRLIGSGRGLAQVDEHNLDFVAINYYTRSCIRAGAFWPPPFFGKVCKMRHHVDSGNQSSIGWEIYPMGLARVIERFGQYGLPMLISENGIATDDDRMRCRFLGDHLRVVAEASAQGAPVFGYMYWSMIDNFEWSLGFGPRFGLVEVDPESLNRRPKPSADLFAKICRAKKI